MERPNPRVKWCMKRNLKDLLSSTFERRVLDFESEAMRGLGSIPTTGFFHIVKPLIQILAFLSTFSSL